jgi:hypothetical protein
MLLKEDLNLLGERFEDRNRKKTYPIRKFEFDKYFIFESRTNSCDNFLYSITTADDNKVLLINGYGVTSKRI